MKNKKTFNRIIIALAVFGVLFSSFVPSFAVEIFGDIDEDGSITAADARLLLRASAGLADLRESSEPGVIYGDIDGDGQVTAADARILLRVSADLEQLKKPTTTTKKETTTQSVKEIQEIVELFNDAANRTKDYTGKMKINITEGNSSKIHDLSGSTITSLVERLFPNDYPKKAEKTYEDGNNIDDYSDTLKSLLAPANEDYMSALTAAGVVKATKTPYNNGYKITLKLVKEIGDTMSFVPEHHATCSDPVFFNTGDLGSYIIEKPIICYPGATIKATINEYDMLSAFSIDESVNIVGTLRILTSSSNFDIEGRWRQELAITYEDLE